MAKQEKVAEPGWGIDKIPYPEGTAMIWTRDLYCVGCRICQLACAMFHFGSLNRELSRIKIQKRMTPVSKSIQSVCAQCIPEERRCEKACPLKDKPAIYFDEQNLHMTVDKERCLGQQCGRCAEACGGDAIHFYPPDYDYAIVCDLCEKEGVRRPQCVDVCPAQALEYMSPRMWPFLKDVSHQWRMSADEKAELIHKRTHPLKWDSLGVTARQERKGEG